MANLTTPPHGPAYLLGQGLDDDTWEAVGSVTCRSRLSRVDRAQRRGEEHHAEAQLRATLSSWQELNVWFRGLSLVALLPSWLAAAAAAPPLSRTMVQSWGANGASKAVANYGGYELPSFGPSKWVIDARGATAAIPQIVAEAPCGGRRVVRWVKFRYKLVDAPLLGSRRTRVSVAWSATKAGWSDNEVEIRTARGRRRVTSRYNEPAVAWRTIYIDVPAAEVRRTDWLEFSVLIAARCLRGDVQGVTRIETLDLRTLP